MLIVQLKDAIHVQAHIALDRKNAMFARQINTTTPQHQNANKTSIAQTGLFLTNNKTDARQFPAHKARNTITNP